MSRILCHVCQRPEKACICSFTCEVNNDIHVVILQHPSEVKQTKGTVALLANSLLHCQVIVGENFSQDEQLAQVLENHQAMLLYPSDDALVLSEQAIVLPKENTTKPPCIIILDGTWKKAYRMFMLSKNLHNLMHICLPESLASAGKYLIRKVAKKNALSSLEACCYALALLEKELKSRANIATLSQTESANVTEDNAGNYQELLIKFAQFNQFQLSFIPK